jgi:predicted RNase H-like HicB family nuclease
MTIICQNSTPVAANDFEQTKHVYECRVWLCPEEVDGGYSAIVPSLPGLATQGETIDEAIENVKGAFRALAAEYTENGNEIPWQKEIDRTKPHGTIEKWILVNV